ncbi:MAG: hypothetical protein J1E81_05675 [Eubacterium sp.]|nr:hypothetical protein [Eubacterium sp.]
MAVKDVVAKHFQTLCRGEGYKTKLAGYVGRRYTVNCVQYDGYEKKNDKKSETQCF